jgi:hypothetical protein
LDIVVTDARFMDLLKVGRLFGKPKWVLQMANSTIIRIESKDIRGGGAGCCRLSEDYGMETGIAAGTGEASRMLV